MTLHPIRPLLLPLSLILALALFLGLAGVVPALAQAGQDPQLLEGARLYEQNCAVCHGADGQGRVGVTLAKNWPSIRPDLRIKNVIRNGVMGSPMPAWSSANGGPLSDAEIEALVSYILSWQNGEIYIYQPEAQPTRPAIAALPDVAGDPNHGALLYDQNCAVCHGPDGLGRVGVALAKNWPSIRADLRIQETIRSGVTGSPMPAWSVDNGGPLSEGDINDLTAFILTLPIPQAETQPTAAPTSGPGMNGLTGVILTLVLFALLFGAILFAQRKPQS